MRAIGWRTWSDRGWRSICAPAPTRGPSPNGRNSRSARRRQPLGALPRAAEVLVAGARLRLLGYHGAAYRTAIVAEEHEQSALPLASAAHELRALVLELDGPHCAIGHAQAAGRLRFEGHGAEDAFRAPPEQR